MKILIYIISLCKSFDDDDNKKMKIYSNTHNNSYDNYEDYDTISGE